MRYLFLFLSIWSILQAKNEVGVRTVSYFDEARKRPVTVEVWYPIDQGIYSKEEEVSEWNSVWIYPNEFRDAPLSSGRFPLILNSHGNWGDRRDRSWFGAAMALRGFIVASVEHFGNTWNNNDPEFYLCPWDRPLDVTYAIDALENDENLRDSIDFNQIGFCGYSLGGMTGLWLAGGRLENLKDETIDVTSKELPRILIQKILERFDFEKSMESYFDDRIKAYFLIAPTSWGFDSNSFCQINKPVHIVYSEGDVVLPPTSHAIYLGQQIESADLTEIPGKANHYVFLNQVSEIGIQKLPHWVYEEDESVNREEVHEFVAELANSFFQKNL